MIQFRKYVILLLLLFITSIATLNQALAWSSIESFESNSDADKFFTNKDCFSDGHIMDPLSYGQFNNTYIPAVLGEDSRPKNESNGIVLTAVLSNAARAIVYFQLIRSGGPAALLGLAAVATEYLIMTTVCSNTYLVAPHEYINRELGLMDCKKQDGRVKNVHPKALTVSDVPFYYSCDPKWDPVAGKQIDPHGADADIVGRVWGYMGAASPYCAGDAAQYARKELVGTVRVEYINAFDRFWDGYDRCSASDKRTGRFLRAGGQEYISPVHYYAYYNFDKSAGKIQICVAAPFTLLPLKIGCSYIAPPAEEYAIDPFLELYTSGTRCYYFLTGRTDLWSLGRSLPNEDSRGHTAKPIKGFLGSDLHVTSTVVGCIKDLLIKVFVSPSNSPGYTNTGFFIAVQDRLRQIVHAALVLYVSLIGIKIMTSQRVPQPGEFMMFILKFGLVLYFTTAGAWYFVENGEAKGLFPTLLWASDEIAGFFLSAQNDNDPIGLCRHWFYGQELLGQRDIDPGLVGAGVEPTIGSRYLKMTIWDLVDCKLVNYINLGSCHYSLGGIIGAWIVGAALMVGGVGLLLGIVSFIYAFLMLLIIFKFTHIFILSAFLIAILVLVSPIFLCFALFQVTKTFFDHWVKAILGYILFPALLFAFVALMLVTLDSLFYGDLDLKTGITADGKLSITQACEGVDSLYCTTVSAVAEDPCSANMGMVGSKMTEKLDLGPLGTFTRLKSPFADEYLKVVVKLMLYTILFYLFLGSVTKFLEVLVGVQGGLSDKAMGSIDIAKGMQKLGGMGMDKMTGMLGKGGGGMMGMMGGGGGGGGGGSPIPMPGMGGGGGGGGSPIPIPGMGGGGGGGSPIPIPGAGGGGGGGGQGPGG